MEFWFDFASTYSYLSAERVEAMAQGAGISVSWRPFLLGPVFKAQGWDTSPFNIYPAKGRYMWRDMERLCAERGLPLTRPDPFPQNSLLATRVALLALDENADGVAFCRAVFRAQFQGGQDISAPDVIAGLLQACGLSLSLMDAAGRDETKARLRERVGEAMARGLFGAPSFTVGDELFWGDDRLDAAIAHAAGRERA
jgi:2-hydroxychromene-2-carboxylate isomerase